MAVKITKGDKSVTVARPRVRQGLRRGPRNGTGPRAGTAACPLWDGGSACSQIGK